MLHNNTASRRCDEQPETEFTSSGPIALDTLVHIIAQNFSSADMQRLAGKVRVEAVRRAA